MSSPRHPLLTLQSRHRYREKVREALHQNAEHFIRSVGLTQVGFLVLTFPQTVTSKVTAEGRFRSLASGLLRRHFGPWAKIVERHRNGGLHLHLLLDCQANIRSGFNYDSHIVGGGPENPNAELRRLRRLLKDSLPGYGFGFRCELTPVQNAEAVSRYLGKQLGDVVTNPTSRRSRVIGYSRDFPKRCSHRFNWNSDGSRGWRHLVAQVARLFGCRNLSQLSVVLGSRWAYELISLKENPTFVSRLFAQDRASPEELALLRAAFRGPGGRGIHPGEPDPEDRDR